MEIEDIVKKLVGEIDPVGETHIDNERLENLKAMTALVDGLLEDICYVTRGKQSHEYSKQQAALHAKNFIDYICAEYGGE